MWEHSATVDRALSRQLLLAEQPIPRFEHIFPSSRARLSYALKRRVPLAAKIAMAEAMGRLDAVRKPAELEEARTVTRAIVTGTHREGELEAIARRRLVAERLHEASFWRARWDRDPVAGGDYLHAAVAAGRGVIISFCHLGAFRGSIAPVKNREGRTTYVATNSWILEPPDGSEWSVRVEHWRRGLARSDGRVVKMPGTFETLAALLERHEVTMLAFDMPGSIDTRFLGKSVMLASGTAKLALRTDALVLPMRRVRRGVHLVIEYGPPVDPRGYDDAGSLHRDLAALHERWILERPEALEDPRRPGAWENCADPSGWPRPQRSA
jgi:lauroyl/myristoyl acyltransferase